MKILKSVALLGWKLVELALLPLLLIFCLLTRFHRRKVDVGLGPEPMINNVYHKRALVAQGYSAETFAVCVPFICDDFDRIFDRGLTGIWGKLQRPFLGLYIFLFTVWRYRAVYIYFNGGPLGLYRSWLWPLEPHLYSLAGVKVLVMPYGGDIQDMLRCPNLLFRHGMATQYPEHRYSRRRIARRIDLWTRYADHVISGCDWVDFMYYWDSLMLGHFSIDTKQWAPDTPKSAEGPLRILHAPNHRDLKGSRYFIQAVKELKAEGLDIELEILERVSNAKVQEAMARADVVADQLIIGWYAMFALEGMAMGKPVLCYLRDDLMQLYIHAGIIKEGEVPLINCSIATVKERIRDLAQDRSKLKELGERSRAFVEKHHSLEAIGTVFSNINEGMGLPKPC